MMLFYEKMNYDPVENFDSILSNINLFKNLSISEIGFIQCISQIKNYKKDETIICKETKNNNLFVLLDGNVAIYPECSSKETDEPMLYTVNKNELFGEISFLFNYKRIASAVAKTDSRVIEIDGDKIKDFMDNNVGAGYKILLNIIKSVSNKLSNTNKEWDNLNRVNKKINSKKIEKETFYRVASHEMKSPVSGVSAILKTIKYMYKNKLNKKIVDMIDSAQKKIDNTIKIINDLFLLSEEDSVQNQTDNCTCNIINTIKHILKNEEARLEEKRISLVKIFDYNNNPEIISSEEDLIIILSNIISNAIRYSYDKSYIIIKNYLEYNRYCISIKDFGIGISKEDIDRIGDDFFRSKNAKEFNREGTGLGMSIVRKLLLKHNGEMEIKSEKGKWTEIIVKFPLSVKGE